MIIKVLSRNPDLYSTKALVTAAEKRNHKVQVIDPLRCDIVIEKKKPEIYYQGQKVDSVDAIIPRIGTSSTYYETAVVRQFEMMNVFTPTNSEALIRSKDALRSLQVLSKAGVELPKTVFTNYSKDVAGVIEQVGGAPLVIKLVEGTRGVGAVLAETQNTAISVLNAFNGLKARVIVQEFIGETIGSNLQILVVDGQVVSAVKQQGKEGELRTDPHYSGSINTIELSDAEENAAIKAARAMKFGVAGVNLLQSTRGPLILKVHSSPELGGIHETDWQRHCQKNYSIY